MSNLPRIDGQKLSGFAVVRIKGRHHFLRHPDGGTTVIPVHSQETIGTGLFHKILKDCDLSVDDFNRITK